MYIFLKWIHLMATIAWIGGMLTNFVVYMPAAGKNLDPPVAGKLMASVMRRFRVLAYISMVLILLTGSLMGILHSGTSGSSTINDGWVILLFLKIAVFLIMLVLGIYAFEFLAPRVARLALNGPSPKLSSMQKSQRTLAMIGFLMGIIVIALSAAL